ncbi:hypothetical protein HS088_TW18G01012 [Tripterygium wilfordii]|uniref:Uncharacterized protein n=1 Tax=Tripterygium wilfordii TaxID=458696 RepID=A0A7J7CDV9_TRIWF|nr:hypothetical protein HS088_TW18G01012 [Tripterygium wilfordii]
MAPSLEPEIGPDGVPREASAIAYTEKIIEEEQLQLPKHFAADTLKRIIQKCVMLSWGYKYYNGDEFTAGPKKAGSRTQ